MRPKIINIVPILINLTRRIEFRIKERYNFLPVNGSAIPVFYTIPQLCPSMIKKIASS
jgi:hypothetical protein